MSQNYEYFGKYILLEKLATGGMAEVWLARAPGAGGIGKFVAIKKILPQFSDNPEFLQMFKDEAAIAMNLSHSNIVSIYEFGQEKNQLFLVMDYVEGRNLRQILNKMKTGSQKFSTDQIIYAIKEIAAGLDHAHRSLNSATGKPLNITHRDMSPQNVMITFEGEVKIVDFGIAKAESQIENTRTGTLKGKFGYMSPEQAEGHATDLRTDVFSLGIVLWELLANDRLFIANNEINTLKKIRECNVPSLTKINPNIHAELERIAMKSLARDRNLRYQTAAAMHRDLNRFLNRQYPDFSPHDFSVFIKTLYTDEILDIRKRLIDYAKVPIRPSAKADEFEKTMITSFPQSGETKTKASNGSKTPVEGTLTVTETFTDSEILQPKTQAGQDKSNAPTKTGASLSGSTSTFSVSLAKPPEEKTSSETKVGSTGATFVPAKGNILDDKFIQDSLQAQFVVTPKAPAHSIIEDDGDSNGGMDVESDSTESRDDRRPSRRRKNANRTSASVNLMIFVACAIVTYIVVSAYFPNYAEKIEGFVGRVFGNGNYASQPAPDSTAKPTDLAVTPDAVESKKPAPPAPKKEAEKTKLPPMAEKRVDPRELPTTATRLAPIHSDFESTTGLVINSVPSGADIYLNGLATGKTTPSRVEVPTQTPFSITLKLSRFLDYTKSGLTPDITGRSLSATLQKAMMGYVDIDVKPPRNARVYINGRILKDEMLPISNYAVPAETPIVIRAENPITGETAEQTVKLSDDQRQKVILKLDRARHPAGRR